MAIEDSLETGSFDLMGWIEDHKDEMQPPVGNTLIWERSEGINHLVMAIRGPNKRRAFHIGPCDEWFYQLEGTAHIELLLEENGGEPTRKLVPLEEGSTFLLPTGVPHNVHRTPESYGIVIELFRDDDEIDEVSWFCENCNTEIHNAVIHEDLARNIQKAAEAFQEDEEARTCSECGSVMAAEGDIWTVEDAEKWKQEWMSTAN